MSQKTKKKKRKVESRPTKQESLEEQVLICRWRQEGQYQILHSDVLASCKQCISEHFMVFILCTCVYIVCGHTYDMIYVAIRGQFVDIYSSTTWVWGWTQADRPGDNCLYLLSFPLSHHNNNFNWVSSDLNKN